MKRNPCAVKIRPVLEMLAVLVVSFALATALRLPTLWLLLPLALLVATGRPLARYGVSLRRPGRLGFHLAVSAAVFIPYVLAHCAVEFLRFGATFHFQLPPHFARQVVEQMLIIALPEEFFFRGYLQTELDRILGKPYRFLGARFGAGLVIAALLFAVCHTPFGGPARLSVFFPGLLYGWLRARTGTIVVPVLYHAVSNLLLSVLVASLR
jgi:membrane protease YdiL (CAAX protease family)